MVVRFSRCPREVSNLRPLRCQRSALPLSYPDVSSGVVDVVPDRATDSQVAQCTTA